ncbi:MAG TPA: hypothetical protein VEJ37_08990 [Xanthobacteraceae bacterium]|nr:hypothetical protein [Xanthobacteraceae bacterium]
MCGLCGALGSEGDWTDRAAMPFSSARTRRAERLERVRIANLVLGQFGLELTDWQGAKYQLASRTGRAEIVDNFAQLWQAAERILRQACDPLDPALIARIERLAATD